MKPYFQAFSASHWNSGVLSWVSSSIWLERETMSTASPVWCSLVPGRATQRAASACAASREAPSAITRWTLLS